MTPADLAAAGRLRAIWDKKKSDRPTQEFIAGKLGNVNQSAVSQYLNGKIPLNFFAVLVFADALGCEPEAIRDDSPELQYFPRTEKTPQAAGWPFKTIARERYDRLGPRDRSFIENQLQLAISHCEGRPDIRPSKRARSG
jgi:hypothetical protein